MGTLVMKITKLSIPEVLGSSLVECYLFCRYSNERVPMASFGWISNLTPSHMILFHTILDLTHTSLGQVLVLEYSIKANNIRCLGVSFEILSTEAICQNFHFLFETKTSPDWKFSWNSEPNWEFNDSHEIVPKDCNLN